MAKMMIDNVIYEGTPEELRDIIRTFEVTEDVESAELGADKPAEFITFEGAKYALVPRKAQEGDVVVFTANNNRFLTNGKPYGNTRRGYEGLRVRDNEGTHFRYIEQVAEEQ